MDPGREPEFDPEDKYSWYFGQLSRDETNELLSPSESGCFLVRGSQSIPGDYVLCVKEDMKISHYIINKQHIGNTQRFRIGDQEFSDIPSLLNFYKTHYLDTTPLIKPAQRVKVVTKFDFKGNDEEDLPFNKGEVLEVISKDEQDWWTCRNPEGRVGQIPVNYVALYNSPEGQAVLRGLQQTVTQPKPAPANNSNNSHNMGMTKPVKLPAKAVVIMPRIPNLYDKTQLRLEKGDVVVVTKMEKNGQWEGEIDGRKGIFPFTHVQFIEEDVNT